MPVRERSSRLDAIGRMLREVSLASTPQAILQAFGERYVELYPTDQYVSLSVRGLREGEYKITRRLDLRLPLHEAVARFRQANPWQDWDRIETRRGGFFGEVIRSPEPRLFTHLDLRDDPVMGDEFAHLHSAIASPLYDNGQCLNWAINFRRDPEGFNEDDLEQSFISANLVGTSTRAMLALSQNRDLTRALTSQFEQVARVQQSLLPQRPPTIPGARIATSYLPSLHAGGDYYDFYPFDLGRWGIMIADVSGHGAAAATVMAMLHALLPARDEPIEPERMIRTINRRLCDSLQDGAFVTAFFALLDPASGDLEYVRCGHNPPRLRRAARAGIVALDGAGALPLGLSERYEFTPQRVRLHPGDSVLMYTDGITEAMDASGGMFGVERLDASIRRSDGTPEGLIDAIHADLFAFNHRRTRDDDQTMVALQYTHDAGDAP